MQKLSNGKDSTLGNHREIAAAFFGEDSPAIKWLDDKIATHENGADEEVVMPESQVVALLAHIHLNEQGS